MDLLRYGVAIALDLCIGSEEEMNFKGHEETQEKFAYRDVSSFRDCRNSLTFQRKNTHVPVVQPHMDSGYMCAEKSADKIA